MFAATPLVLFLATAGLHDPVVGPPLVRTIDFALEVRCEGGPASYLEDVEVRIAVPDSDRRQKLLGLTLFPTPSSDERDAFGNRVAVFRFPRIDAQEVRRVGWKVTATLFREEHAVDRAKLRPLDETPPSIKAVYLCDGVKYCLRDPSIIRTADAVRQGATDPLDLALRINDCVRERLEYRMDGVWDDAARVLANRHGSCSEYSFLFVALARKCGLAARYVGASALRAKDGPYVDTLHHRWVEVFLPGYGWYPIDPSRNDGEEGGAPNGYLGRTPSGLLRLMRGDGGPSLPLRWGYVASTSARPRAGGRLETDKRFAWRP